MEVFEPIKSSIFKNKFEVSENLNQIMEKYDYKKSKPMDLDP